MGTRGRSIRLILRPGISSSRRILGHRGGTSKIMGPGVVEEYWGVGGEVGEYWGLEGVVARE